MVAGKNSRRGLWNHLAEKADENFNAANFLLEKEYYNAACNRFYYAVFQMLFGVLLDEGIDEKSYEHKHEKVSEFLKNKYSETGELTRTFNLLKGYRIKADYNREISLTEQDCQRCYDLAKSCYPKMKTNHRGGKPDVLDGF